MPTSIVAANRPRPRRGLGAGAAPPHVAFIPSVSGGLGHVGRTLHLARALERAQPRVRISYILDELELRPFNVDAVARTGYPIRFLPNPVHHERNEKIRAVMGDVDVVIEDTNRRLIAHRRILPRLRTWISIPMLPIWDELHLDWPLLEHADHILYAYPPVMPPPEELLCFGPKLTVTGPILDVASVPSRAEARRRLGLDPAACYVTYAPRGFPFGPWFGRRVLNGVVGGVMRLRRQRPEVRLVLTAVPDPTAIQPPGLPPLERIDGVELVGVVSPETARDYIAAANAVVVEGTSTLFDAATVCTPVVMVPGLIHETALEGTWVNEHGAGIVLRPEQVTRASMAAALRAALDPVAGTARAERLHALVGTGGRDLAVDTICRVIEERGET